MLKLKNFDNLLFLLISLVIFITAGNFIEDYIRLIFLKLIIIILIAFKINLLKETKTEINKNKKVCVILILFIISVTISLITSPSKINQFAFEWLRVRYVDTVTDFILFIFLYLYFKDRNINYNILIKSIAVPGILFSIFIIYQFISNEGLSNSNKEIIFFDGVRMVGMLFTFLITFYLGCLHSILKDKNIQNIFILSVFITLTILLMGRGTVVAILATYIFMCVTLFFNKKKFINEFIIFIISIGISILLAQIIFQLSSSNNFVYRTKDEIIITFDRINLWKYGCIIFLENPFFGKGPGGFTITAQNDFYANRLFGLEFGSTFPHNHPHNFFIQFLVEWGIIGTLLILILLIKLGISSLKYFFKYKKNHLLIPSLSIIGLTTHGLVDGALYHATFTFYFVLFLSILCSEISKKLISNHK